MSTSGSHRLGGSEPAQQAPLARSGLERLRASFLRPSLGQAVVAVLVGVLAFAAVTQVRLAGTGNAYAGLRQAELVQALNGLQAATARSERDLADLRVTRDRLRSSSQRRAAAIAQARRELDTLSILAGTSAARGPGIEVTLTDPAGGLTLTHLLNGIEELRNAGVEALEINNRVRVIAQTSFEDDPAGVKVDNVLLKSPYVIDAIGDPNTLTTALAFQDGFIDNVKTDGGRVTVRKKSSIVVSVTRTPSSPRWAQPAAGQ